MKNRLVPAILFLGITCLGQDQPATSSAVTSRPAITFVLDWQGVEPPHYSLKVDESCNASYKSATPRASTDEDATTIDFVMTSPNCQRIFQLAAQANYFHGDFDFHKHKIADTGRKTLTYSGPSGDSSTSYNWSENQAIEQLTEIFRSIGATLEDGQKLTYLLRFDKLGLEQQLKGMQETATSGQLRELQVIAPVLQRIASDSSVMEIARQRARTLLRRGQ